jgi:uncharacterized membrane protein
VNGRFAKLAAKFAETAKSDVVQNAARDMKSLRALWNWVYMALYVWICVWSVLHYPETIPTVVTATAGVVSVIFTGYVLSKTYEKVKNGNGNGNGGHKPLPGGEHEAGD